jgi:hypothetical protein
MKKNFSYLFVFFIFFSSSHFIHSSQDEITPSHYKKPFRGKATVEKIYLHPGMAQITPNGIVIQINHELVTVPVIESDEHGVFIPTHFVAGKVKPGEWCCTSCWQWNSSSRWTCWWCGADREDEN